MDGHGHTYTIHESEDAIRIPNMHDKYVTIKCQWIKSYSGDESLTTHPRDICS